MMTDKKQSDNLSHGAQKGHTLRIALIASRQHEKLVESLVRSAVSVLMSYHVPESQMRIMWAPQIFQFPLLAQSMAQSKEFDGILVLGVQAKDITDSYYFENAEVMRGLMDVMMMSSLPVNPCIITTEELRDAKKLALAKGDKNPAAIATHELIELLTA